MVKALRASPSDIGAERAMLDWIESRHIDETLSFTTLFEEHGYRGARTNALDIVIAALMGLDCQRPVVWPLHPYETAAEIGGSGVVVMDGAIMQRGSLHARTVLCPVEDRLVSLAVSAVEEQLSGETTPRSPWVRVQVWGCPSGDLGPWSEVRRRGRLALASELVGVSRRIIDSAADHVRSPRRPGREALSDKAARSSLTQALAKMADVRALIAACWADGSFEAAERAVTAATATHDAAAQHVATICGEIDVVQLHPMRFLVEQRHGEIYRFPFMQPAVSPAS